MAADVSRIELTFTDRYETGEILEPDISCGTSGVSIDSVDWSREPENWRPGTSVTATLTLSSGGEVPGRQFSGGRELPLRRH